ncbi:MAG TPA: NAD-dependent epimerase/dehydratase family protein [Nitrospirales bacterium]|nr:NAD-dependent epimerase/dehydratase family protein [Nitrospirales bacterium]
MVFAILDAIAHKVNTNNAADLSICPLSKYSLRFIAAFKMSTNLSVPDPEFRLGNGWGNTLFSSRMTRILLTGASGFLGKQLVEKLKADFELLTIGRSKGNDIAFDFSSGIYRGLGSLDCIIHAAGLAHKIPSSQSEQDEFFRVNLGITDNLLKSLLHERTLPKSFLFISSVSVYGLMRGENISEDHPLQANDPYGKSKVEAEYLLRQWCEVHGVALTILRLPLLAGAFPPGNLGAMINAMKNGRYFSIDGGKARKSIVMASDVAKIIPTAIDFPGVYHLTDGHHPSFFDLEGVISGQLGVSRPRNIPAFAARCIGFCGKLVDIITPGRSPITPRKVEKIISTLTFNDQKARQVLGWNPSRVIDAFRIS